MRLGRVLTAVAVTATAVSAGTMPAWAAAPANDTFAGATVIGSLPFTETLDTTEATTDADDAEASADCQSPAGTPPTTEASVWYSLTLASDEGVQVDTFGSDYEAGVIVVTGSPGSFSFVACGFGEGVSFAAAAGTTYHLLAFDSTPGGGNGGTLNISVALSPTVQVTVDPVGHVDLRTGVATVSGTFTCSNGEDVVIEGRLRQNVGRVFAIQGEFSEVHTGMCDGSAHAWSAEVIPESGRFAAGKAIARVVAFVCTPVTCAVESVEQTIRLRP